MVERVKRMRAGEADPNAIKTGIASLDKFTGGFHRGEYIVLGARPSMGKTALATQIAYNVAGQRRGTFYASLEMPTPLITPAVCLLPPMVRPINLPASNIRGSSAVKSMSAPCAGLRVPLRNSRPGRSPSMMKPG